MRQLIFSINYVELKSPSPDTLWNSEWLIVLCELPILLWCQLTSSFKMLLMRSHRCMYLEFGGLTSLVLTCASGQEMNVQLGCIVGTCMLLDLSIISVNVHIVCSLYIKSIELALIFNLHSNAIRTNSNGVGCSNYHT